jgi:hypothetical protein
VPKMVFPDLLKKYSFYERTPGLFERLFLLLQFRLGTARATRPHIELGMVACPWTTHFVRDGLDCFVIT